MANILYISAHHILERDEVILLNSCGHNVCSVSNLLSNPNVLADTGRIDRSFINALREEYGAIPENKNNIQDAFYEAFDTVICMHDFRWIQANEEKLAGKRVILRTIGQYLAEHEAMIAAIKKRKFEIVRYSPTEQNIPGYAGHDAIIRFYKDPTEYGPWSPKETAILCFGNTLLRRPTQTMLSFLIQATSGFDLRLYGSGNEGLSAQRGVAKPGDMCNLFASHAVYYSHHTMPASYTLSFIEAMMTGMPVVAPGSRILASAASGPFKDAVTAYEVPSIITNGKDGFTVNSIEEAHRAFATILSNRELAASVGQEARATAISLFGFTTIKKLWEGFLS